MHIPLPIIRQSIRQTVNFREKIAGPIFYACYSMETETSVDGKNFDSVNGNENGKITKN